MTVLGIAFTKLGVEKTGQVQGSVNVQSNANIVSVEKLDVNIGTKKDEALKFVFSFTAVYQPNIAKISIDGEVVWLDKPDEVDKIIKGWKKDKKIPKEVMSPVLNTVLSKSNIEALILSRELNLPPPIQLPRVEIKD
ncbi:MAG: hypothetical protein AABX39_06330 [Nanoarchaeota archaeon]